MSDSGYDTKKYGFSVGTSYEQYENTFFSPTLTVDFEDLTTSSKASENLRKQSGDYFETKFNYSLSFDNKIKDPNNRRLKDCFKTRYSSCI